MNIRNALHLSTVAVLLAGGTSLMSQVTTGALNGQVTDELGNPIAGARVVLESPALFQPRTYMTNAKGEYRALLLPVGNYVIKVSASGKLSKTASEVRVGVGANLSMPFILRAQKASESATVEVVSNAASESKSDDKVSVNYSAEQLMQMPVGLTFQDVVQLAPGVTGYGTDAQIRGSGTNQIMYRIDGINVKDDTGSQTSLYNPLPDSIEDMQVVLSALNARNGLVQGGQVNIVTKTGGNTFEGSIRAYFTRPSWTADYPHTPAGNYGTAEDWSRKTDITVSGPIIPDRLWFYFGTQLQPSSPTTIEMGSQVEGTVRGNSPLKALGTGSADAYGPRLAWSQIYGPNAIQIGGTGAGAGLATYLPTIQRNIYMPMATYGLYPDVDGVIYGGPNAFGASGYKIGGADAAGQIQTFDDTHKHYEGKLTGMITSDNVLSLTYLYHNNVNTHMAGEHDSTGDREYRSVSQFGSADDKRTAWTLSYSGVISDKWSVEARLYKATWDQNDSNHVSPGPSIQSYYASSDPTVMFDTVKKGYSANENMFWQSGYKFGPFMDSPSIYYQPERHGNDAWSFNVKTFQEALGQHEIDMGAERVETVYNYGRSKKGDFAIFSGGGYYGADGAEMFPVYHRVAAPGAPMPIILAPGSFAPNQQYTSLWLPATGAWNNGAVQNMANLPDGNQPQDRWVHWGDTMREDSAQMEHFWTTSRDTKNHTTSMWLNDTWTINSNWNAMAGVRFNQLYMQATNGGELASQNIVEPRFQVKFNPDGKNKEVWSFSAARLAAAYSDQMANNFRGNEWDVRTIHKWNGAALNQPGIDDPAVYAGGDTPTGSIGGFNYSGQNMHGVRFVNYATITNINNYGPASLFLDNTQSCVTAGIRAPYTIEFNLGYQRNYDTGFFKLSLVQRTYKDAFVNGARNYGDPWIVKLHSPDPSDKTSSQYSGTVQYFNADVDSVYTGLELAWRKAITSKLSFEGSYTWAQTTGYDLTDYYNFQNLRVGNTPVGSLLTPQQAAIAVSDGYSGKTNTAHITFTYVKPIGKGNVSFSLRTDYWRGGVGQLRGYGDYTATSKWNQVLINPSDPANANGLKYADGTQSANIVNSRGGLSGNLVYAQYYSRRGAFDTGSDYYQANGRIQGDVPLGIAKIRLISYISISNVYNHAMLNNYASMLNGDGNTNTGNLGGRMSNNWKVVHGLGVNGGVSGMGGTTDWGNGDSGRRYVGDFSIGIKF